MNFVIPTNVSRVTETLKSAGFEAFLVGGCVRDLLISKLNNVSREPKDWDITTNAKPEQIVKLFEDKGFKVVYENVFGTVSIIFEDESLDSSVRDIQITPYRLESTYSDNRHPDSVSFSDTINDDLSRRDFTMNAIALDPETFEIIDPFHGKQAIEKQMIISVGDATERFLEGWFFQKI
jgi:tRNA nucleotidyltransferase/poly(A) polymerase